MMKLSLSKKNVDPFYIMLLAIFSLINLTPLKLYSQIVAPPHDSNLQLDSIGQAIVTVELQDTTDINGIEVLIGSAESASDIFSNIYIYDQIAELPSGQTYLRNGIHLLLGVGLINIIPAYYVKVRLSNGSNTWSSWFTYIAN